MAPAQPNPVLGRRALNRALLARQLLLERSRQDIPEVLELMGGLQAQYAPAMYVGLWSRMAGLRRDDLTRALTDRRVIQATLLRATIHLVSAADYWPLAIAVREARRIWFLGVQAGGLTESDMAAAAARVRERLGHESPISRTQLEAIAGKERMAGIGLWIDLVRVPPSGTWERRRADLFAAAEDWVGPEPSDVSQDAAVDHLVRRYLTGFGPSTMREIATWGGLRPETVVASLERLRLDRLGAESGEELVDLPGSPRPDPQTPAPVRFIAVWDAALLVHARSSGILPEEYRARVFNVKMPQSVNTFLVRGEVAGTWRYAGGEVELQPFRPLPAGVRREAEQEGGRLAAFHAKPRGMA